METIDDKTLKRFRTRGTVEAILDLAQGVDLDELISEIYVRTDVEIIDEMIKEYEKQLILAFVNPEKFKAELNVFYKDMARMIKQKNLHHSFFGLYYHVTTIISQKENNKNNGLNMYANILLQQPCYFVKHPYMVVGVTDDDSLITRKEPYPYLDFPTMLAYIKKDDSIAIDLKKYRQYGMNVGSQRELALYWANDQMLTNESYAMAYFINEHTQEILPVLRYHPAHGIILPEVVESTEKMRELLEDRRNLLPVDGVEVELLDYLTIRRIFFKEAFVDGSMFMLYRADDNYERSFYGYYDFKRKYFFSVWLDSNGENEFHLPLENFILEIYCFLTTEIESSEAIKSRIERVESVNPDYESSKIRAMFKLHKKDISAVDKNHQHRLFDRRKYQEDKISVNPYIRKLPVGARASDEAIALAKEFGIRLNNNETFVKPFSKVVYKSKKRQT